MILYDIINNLLPYDMAIFNAECIKFNWFRIKYLEMPFYISSKFSIFSRRKYCDVRNKWKSDDAKSGEYGGWGNISRPIC